MTEPVWQHAPSEVLARLHGLTEHDAPTRGGRVLSYVYDAGLAELDRLAADAAVAVQQVNALDPTTFGSVAVLEREVVGFVRDLVGGAPIPTDPPEAGVVAGSVTTGGTESCLLAIRTARDIARAERRQVTRVVAPQTVHAAFHKACEWFDLQLDLVPVDTDGHVDPAAMISRLGSDVALVVLSAPCYPYATLDPVAEVAPIAAERGVAVHVDACIGGMILPFWPGLPAWDLRVPGVTSLAVDLHKYGYAPKGVSVLLHRGLDRHRAQYFSLTRWPGYPVVNPTMTGSRPAAPLAAAWAILQALGRDGLARLAADCVEATQRLLATVADIDGLAVVGEPTGPLIALRADLSVSAGQRVDPHRLADAIRQHGWLIQPQPAFAQPDGAELPATTHLTVTPVTLAVVDELSAALRTAADAVRGVDPAEPIEPQGYSPGGFTALDSRTAWLLLQALGAQQALGHDQAGLMATVAAGHPVLIERLLTELLARTVDPEP